MGRGETAYTAHLLSIADYVFPNKCCSFHLVILQVREFFTTIRTECQYRQCTFMNQNVRQMYVRIDKQRLNKGDYLKNRLRMGILRLWYGLCLAVVFTICPNLLTPNLHTWT